MWPSIIYLATALHFIISPTVARNITVPLYKRTIPSFYAANGEELNDGLLAGEMIIGNPPQKMKLVFDTTSGYTWTRGSQCKSENCLDRCTFYTRRSRSIEYTGLRHSVSYGDACVDTKVWKDTVEFAGVEIPHSYFGVANRMNGFDHGFDGYFGLGPAVKFGNGKYHTTAASSLQKRDGPPSTFLSAAFQLGLISSPQFSIYITTGGGTSGNSVVQPTTTAPVPAAPVPIAPAPAQPAPQQVAPQNNNVNSNPPSPQPPSPQQQYPASTGFIKRGQHLYEQAPVGQLIFGGIDQTKIDGQIYYLPLSSPRKNEVKGWNICLQKAEFGNKLKLHQYDFAIASISSSSPYITMPPSQADCFHEKFGAVYQQSTGTYTIKCSKLKSLPPLILEFDSITVELPADVWTGVTNSGQNCCHTKIRRGGSEHDWVLGTTFTHAFYSVFDSEKEAIGFGLLKGSENGVKITAKK
ncbi:aspartic peptidase domain-containing protein [Umbelopsis sp. AD052]|nr:aspartic peptidase domain-containing protein [Umbelopsis sp. AD052]